MCYLSLLFAFNVVMTRSRTCTANNIWARFLLIYLYAVSDEDYDDDDTVRRGANACFRSGPKYLLRLVT